jgi:hypothetical protein
MSEPYSRQTITQYLLGSLPEAETETFDELSITDDKFAEALSAVEKDLIDAYVQGELTGTELERFESHYLVSPLRRDKVRFAQAFQDFAKSNAGTRAAEIIAAAPAKSVPERKRAGWLAALSAFNGRRLALSWGLAIAVLVLVAAGGWLAFENFRLRQQVSQDQARRDVLMQREQDLQKELEQQRSANSKTEQELARVTDERERLEKELGQSQADTKSSSGEGSIVSLILAPPLRSASQVATISIKPGTKHVAAQLQLEAADYSAYRVELIDPAGNQMLWRSGSLKPRVKGERKSLAATFPAELLKPRNYILSVTGISGNGSDTVGHYPFRVVK